MTDPIKVKPTGSGPKGPMYPQGSKIELPNGVVYELTPKGWKIVRMPKK